MSALARLTEAFAAGQRTPAEETDRALAAIAARDGAIRAFTHIDAEGARAAAAESSARWRRGQPLSPLDGVPVAMKDNIAVKDLPWTAGMAHRRGIAATRDSAVSERLKDAGAVIIGMANMHEAALGATTDNPFYGRTDNPAFPGHTPGGSSGGSAAAVAAGYVPLAFGTDTLGSIRIPAAYCGIAGLKPSPGTIDREGLIALSTSLDTIGPLARDADDLAIAMAAICPDWNSARQPMALADLKFGLLDTTGTEIDPAIARAFTAAVLLLKKAGAKMTSLRPQAGPLRLARRAGLLLAESEGAAIHREALDAVAPMSETLRAMLDFGRRLPAEKLTEARNLLAAFGSEAGELLTGLDVLLLPTAPQCAFDHGISAPANQADLTALANAAGLPAISIPLVSKPGAAPMGLQLIGRRHDDARLVAIAGEVAREMAS